MIKIQVVTIFLFFVSIKAMASETAIEKICRISTQAVAEYATYPSETLTASKEAIKSIASLEEYEKITGQKRNGMVQIIIKYRKVSFPEAEVIVLKMYKDIELEKIRRAIELKPFLNEVQWDKEYQNCVAASEATLKSASSTSARP